MENCDITGWVWESLQFKPTNITTPGYVMNVGFWDVACSYTPTSPTLIPLLAVLVGREVFMVPLRLGRGEKRVSLPVI